MAAHELVHKLLSQLKPDDQMVIRMLDLEQKTIAEISGITGWNQSLIKVRAFRARRTGIGGGRGRGTFLRAEHPRHYARSLPNCKEYCGRIGFASRNY